MNNYVLAFLAGVMGSVIGGNGAFMMTGFIGIMAAVMEKCGGDASVLNGPILGILFMPCVMFNGACASLAYSANVKHYLHNGQNLNRSMLFTQDPIVLLIGGTFGLLGYLVLTFLTNIGFPADGGACTVFLLGALIRVLWGNKKYITKNIEWVSKEKGINEYIFQIIMAGVIAYVTAYFVQMSGIVSLGFSISAFSLVFMFLDPFFPATHHITMIAGYAIMQTGNFALVVLFAAISEVIFILANKALNYDLDTHLDAPAIAIMITSLLIFTLC